MAKKLFQRYLPTPEKIRNNPNLKMLGRRLLDPNLWHLNRRSVAQAFFVGIFVAFIPMPFQMAAAAFLALLVRCNLPIAVSLVWITNPVTMPVIWFATYKIGCFILQIPVTQNHQFEASLGWLMNELGRIWLPLYLGSILTGLLVGSLSYISIRLFWRWHIVRVWKQRQQQKR